MAKILSSWRGVRKYLEKEILAESLCGRVRYNCTAYVGMDGCHIFEIYVEGRLAKQFSLETVNSYFIKNGYISNSRPLGIEEYWEEFGTLLESTPMQSRSELTDEEFCEALKAYRQQDIKISINSDNPLERMFAVLDRRVGKRTLIKIKETVSNQPEWLKEFYFLRLEAECI